MPFKLAFILNYIELNKKIKSLFFKIIFAFLIFQLSVSFVLAAEQSHLKEVLDGPNPNRQNDIPANTIKPTFQAKVDNTHKILSNSILTTARWMDSFFYDERYAKEENKTRIKIKTSSFWELDHATEYKIRADINLVLPGFEDRLALAFTGDEEEEGVGLDATNNINPSSFKSTKREDTTVSLRYIIKTIERRNINATLGFQWRDSRIVTIPELRWRETFALHLWELRFVQRLRWYSDVGWETKTSFDLDRLICQLYLFRTTLDGTWSENDETKRGYIYNLNFSLSHPLSPNKALIYEFGNKFYSKSSTQLEETALRVRYRQKVWRDWLYLEVAPQLAFPREEDYHIVPGFLVFFEAIVGHYQKNKSFMRPSKK
jgi:hypothetical protein